MNMYCFNHVTLSEGMSCSARLQIKVTFCDFLHAIHGALVSGSVRVIEHTHSTVGPCREGCEAVYMVEHADTT